MSYPPPHPTPAAVHWQAKPWGAEWKTRRRQPKGSHRPAMDTGSPLKAKRTQPQCRASCEIWTLHLIKAGLWTTGLPWTSRRSLPPSWADRLLSWPRSGHSWHGLLWLAAEMEASPWHQVQPKMPCRSDTLQDKWPWRIINGWVLITGSSLAWQFLPGKIPIYFRGQACRNAQFLLLRGREQTLQILGNSAGELWNSLSFESESTRSTSYRVSYSKEKRAAIRNILVARHKWSTQTHRKDLSEKGPCVPAFVLVYLLNTNHI